MQGLLRKVVAFFLDFLETIVVALSIFVVVYLFLFQPHEVKGGSMEPNFHDGEYILTDKISYRFKSPERGEVIIFKSPTNPDIDYIKRIIGLPGDTLMVRDDSVYLNGKILTEPYIIDKTVILGSGFLTEGKEISVSDDRYFVMGDNRGHSADSREFGPISKKSIIGKALIRYWPIPYFGVIEHVNYTY
ncbi:signal peptidase I [Candidatus Gottesmanbacteria bacterium]|nr:signal peptidase I [Candidatus Gottesmanbacteria bacterium]